MPWLALTVEVDGAEAGELSEALSEAFLDSGAQSVSIEGIGGRRQSVTALLGLAADPGAVMARAASACGLAGVPGFALSRIEDQDWVRRSQAQFGPIRVDARLWIVPSWRLPSDPASRSQWEDLRLCGERCAEPSASPSLAIPFALSYRGCH